MKRFGPKNCSIVVFNDNKEDDFLPFPLLVSTYKTVVVKKDKREVIKELKRHKNQVTLLLINAAPSTDNECPEILMTVVRLLKEGLIHNTVPIVCSTSECPHFMVKCMNEGAADYILNPPSEDVIKTLFLNVVRYTQPIKEEETEDEMMEEKNVIKYGKVWPRFKERLKSVFLQETWLSKLIAEYYTPKPTLQRSSMRSMLSDRKEYLRSQICTWNFLPLDLEPKDLIEVAYLILDQVLTSFEELKSLCVPSSELYHFIFDVCNSYHGTNPYHNFRHAVDVMQANYYFLCRMGLIKPMYPTEELFNIEYDYQNPIVRLLTPLDIFALLMASIGHDVGHPGVNNNFMVTTSTPLAIIYNDKSVLESFHAMSFFHILQDNCFRPLTDIRSYPAYSTFRKIVVNSILATDMSLHDEYVQKITEQSQRLNHIDPSDSTNCEKEKIILCAALIKCADISNCARPFNSAKRWAQILAEEFFEQGELEKEFGMNVLPMNERGKVQIEDFQLNFKRFIALKLFEAVTSVTKDMEFTVDIIHENISIWESMKKDKQGILKQKESNEQHKIMMTPNNTLSPNILSSDSTSKSSLKRSRSGI